MTKRDPIQTEFVDPPLRDRRFDWAAYRDPEGPLIGRGATREAAIAALLALEADAETGCHLVDGKYCSVYADKGVLIPCPNRCGTMPAIGPVPIPASIKSAVPAFDQGDE